MRKRVVIGLLGLRKDAGSGNERWKKWRPTVALCQHKDLPISRIELLHVPDDVGLCHRVAKDIAKVSSKTEVRPVCLNFKDPWGFEDVYGTLHDFARAYRFNPEKEDYLVHVNVGTHVARICLFLLTESRHFPGRMIQSVPPVRSKKGACGDYQIIDLDLSKYDRIASRFALEQQDALSFLKSGINTRNRAFNRLIERIEEVALASRAPILLTGPTGAGKSLLARRAYELRKARGLVTGNFVEVNSATLRGAAAMSALFGHVKGAFTGAIQERQGLLRAADGGILFLDEIGELGREEQAMLLRALEEKTFLPVGSDREVKSDFLLIAGTNHDLQADIEAGRFREDLLARINLWTFRLPSLCERPEDIEPNLDYELDRCTELTGTRVSFNQQARKLFLRFATSPEALWRGNFRDLNGAVTRMGTLARGGRISAAIVKEELGRLLAAWSPITSETQDALLHEVLEPAQMAELDRFERVQLTDVLQVCRAARTLSEAGRRLFAASRKRKTTQNDANRLRKYLARYAIDWRNVLGSSGHA